MKKSLFTHAQILGIALLASIGATPIWAAPDPNPSPDGARSDLRVNNDESFRTYRGTVAILLPNNEFNARIDGRIYKIYATESTRDLRVGDSIRIYGQLDRVVNIRYAKITKIEDRNDNRPSDRDNNGRSRDDNRRDRDDDWRDDNNWRDRDNSWRDRNDNERDNRWEDRDVYFGEVTYVRNHRDFEVRSDNRTYRVYSIQSVRDLNRGDRVRISGERANNNYIRNARIDILRGDNQNYRDNDGVSYVGTVASVRTNRDFDVWVDGFVYNIYTQNPVRELRTGDKVRVNGQRFGSNDIRDASARIVRSR